MDIKPISLFLTAFIVIMLGLIVVQQTAADVESINIESLSSSQDETYTVPSTLTAGLGITSLTAKIYNDTWLDFDGDDDKVAIPSIVTESLTFWYKNETSNWIFIANSSGTLYVDAVANTPNQYPVYHNGTHYIFGKENATSFLNVSIDDARGYNSTIDTSLINLIFDGGRA